MKKINLRDYYYWSLGDTMMITIVRADVNLGKIDFEVAPASTK